jgi:hypothetical protein
MAFAQRMQRIAPIERPAADDGKVRSDPGFFSIPAA